MVGEEFPDTLYGGFKIETTRFRNKQLACIRDQKTTVGNRLAASEGFDFGRASSFVPLARYCRFNLKMDLILITYNSILVVG